MLPEDTLCALLSHQPDTPPHTVPPKEPGYLNIEATYGFFDLGYDAQHPNSHLPQGQHLRVAMKWIRIPGGMPFLHKDWLKGPVFDFEGIFIKGRGNRNNAASYAKDAKITADASEIDSIWCQAVDGRWYRHWRASYENYGQDLYGMGNWFPPQPPQPK